VPAALARYARVQEDSAWWLRPELGAQIPDEDKVARLGAGLQVGLALKCEPVAVEVDEVPDGAPARLGDLCVRAGDVEALPRGASLGDLLEEFLKLPDVRVTAEDANRFETARARIL